MLCCDSEVVTRGFGELEAKHSVAGSAWQGGAAEVADGSRYGVGAWSSAWRKARSCCLLATEHGGWSGSHGRLGLSSKRRKRAEEYDGGYGERRRVWQLRRNFIVRRARVPGFSMILVVRAVEGTCGDGCGAQGTDAKAPRRALL